MAMESHFNPILDATMSSKTFRLSISLPLIILSTPKYPSTQLSTSDGESAEYKKEKRKIQRQLVETNRNVETCHSLQDDEIRKEKLI